MTEQERTELEQTIRARATEFEIPALLDALRLLGYGEGEIVFHSRAALHHGAALVAAIEFSEHPRQVQVTVNLGLLSAQGPLPMYVWEILQDQRDDSLCEFFWFLDEHLLRQRFAAVHPERDPQSMPEWPSTRKQLLLLLKLGTPMGAHWLFSRFFTELDVVVRRRVGQRTLLTPEVALGGEGIGAGSTLGGITQMAVGGIEVFLICNEEDERDAAAWIGLSQQRLQSDVMPILYEQNPYLVLQVTLVLRRRAGMVALSGDRHLGIDRVAPPVEAVAPVQQLVLFSGEVRTAIAGAEFQFRLSPSRASSSRVLPAAGRASAAGPRAKGQPPTRSGVAPPKE